MLYPRLSRQWGSNSQTSTLAMSYSTNWTMSAKMSRCTDSNRKPSDYKSVALPIKATPAYYRVKDEIWTHDLRGHNAAGTTNFPTITILKLHKELHPNLFVRSEKFYLLNYRAIWDTDWTCTNFNGFADRPITILALYQFVEPARIEPTTRTLQVFIVSLETYGPKFVYLSGNAPN